MKQKKIGQMIRKGSLVAEIRKEIPDFPDEPTIEYFVKKGYAKSTTQYYLRALKRNKLAKEGLQDMILVESEHADYSNLLVDTCVMGSSRNERLIEEAKHVTFIYSILEEMDKKSKERNSGLRKLQANIRKYTTKILAEPDKFMVSRFKGYDSEKYCDNILLQYLQILPRQIRPTLLTADKNLAAKARALELEYILLKVEDAAEVEEDAPKHDQTSEEEKIQLDSEFGIAFVKKLKYGMKLYRNERGLFLKYDGSYQLHIVRDGSVISYKKNEKNQVERGDWLHLWVKDKDNISEYKVQI